MNSETNSATTAAAASTTTITLTTTTTTILPTTGNHKNMKKSRHEKARERVKVSTRMKWIFFETLR